MDDVAGGKLTINTNPLTLHQMKKLNFYSAPYILAPSTIPSLTVALTAANLFFKVSNFGLRIVQ